MEKRSEGRILQRIEFYVNVEECEENPDLIGESFECEALDISPKGMKLGCEELFFEGNVLNVTIGVGEPFTLYLLRGEVRWGKEKETGRQFGIKILADDLTDYESWVAEFENIFSKESKEIAEEDDLDAFLREIEE